MYNYSNNNRHIIKTGMKIPDRIPDSWQGIDSIRLENEESLAKYFMRNEPEKYIDEVEQSKWGYSSRYEEERHALHGQPYHKKDLRPHILTRKTFLEVQ